MTGHSLEYRELDDRELLRRHVDGDHEAFSELVRRHRDRLWAVALRTLGDPDDAADALQDGLINAFRRAASFRAESAVTTWLHRIVVNACLDRVRHAAARPSDPIPFDGTEGATITGLSDHVTHLDDRTATRLDLEAALAQLPAEQRVPLVLVDVEGYRVADVCELLGLPAGTIKSRCARGRARLLAILTGSDRPPGSGNRGDDSRVLPADPEKRGGDHR